MPSLPRSRLLHDALAARDDDEHADVRERLRSSYLSFRTRASVLAGEIARSFAHLTIHDGTHLDALWEMADLAVEDDLSLNPLEAYVLGGAILLHDLGLSVAAYASDEPLRTEPRWSDAVAVVLKQRLGRFPTRAEIDAADEAAQRAAEELLLRRLHAIRAETLALAHWDDERGAQHYLIEDSELREMLGPTIGKLAHSHWWETAELSRQFPSDLGALPGCPVEWTIDPLKLACILRVADAIHLDSRRAPMFMRVLRRPTGIATDHWAFQERLLTPQAVDGRVKFTSGRGFPPSESQAWWLCFETLQDIDRWLRQVDALLADLRRQRLRIRGVVGVDSPDRLADHIPTEGWHPVDTHVQISNVAGLVEALGGRELYGDDLTIPLRELIQNACDAVRARRKLQRRSDDWGAVSVHTGEDDDGDWLEVQDTGVGMTQHVLTKGLLDFGTSYWASRDLPSEFPGLLAAEFEAAGRFGIGFFSVFMLGARVRVTTRPYRAGEAETMVLEFSDGLRERPLLRAAGEGERLVEPGTAVRIWSAPNKIGTWFQDLHQQPELSHLCRWLCPALDVTLHTEDGTSSVEISPDWQLKSPERLMAHVLGMEDLTPALRSQFEPYLDNIRPILAEDGRVVARLAIHNFRFSSIGRREHEGVVTLGGLRSCMLDGLLGIVVGHTTTASRRLGVPVIADQQLAGWATGQATLLAASDLHEPQLAECAHVVLSCGGDVLSLPFVESADGWLGREGLAAWAADRSEVVFVHNSAVNIMRRSSDGLQLSEGVISLPMRNRKLLELPVDIAGPLWPAWRNDRDHSRTFWLAAQLVYDAWGLSTDAVRDAVQRQLRVASGLVSGGPIFDDALILRRP